MTLRLRFAAMSDVGRVRKDNQDSGYAGPWLLTVCDGVGGAARGDIASSTAVQQLRRLDEPPVPEHTEEELLGLVSGALHRAHDRIGELVEHDPSLNGTSTTATVALFDGEKLAMGHVGDSRAYLFRDGGVSQITHDHTFVQTLIDEGRITEEESRTHPHRNLILKALDGSREVEPDLFIVDLEPGDRIMLCSDGVSGVLSDGRLADVLGSGTPDFAAVELIRVSLEAGSTDNVTCIVADVVEAGAGTAAETTDDAGEGDTAVVPARHDSANPDTLPDGLEAKPAAPSSTDPEPQLVGAAAELRRKLLPDAVTGLFRGHRMGDTGELDPVPAEDDDGHPVEPPPGAIAADPEEARYALHPPRRHPVLRTLLGLLVAIGLIWVALAGAWTWTQTQWFVGEQDGEVVIYRGVNTTVLGFDLYEPYQTTGLEISGLADVYQQQIADGVPQDSLEAARDKVRDLAADSAGEDEPAVPDPSPSPADQQSGSGTP